MRSDRLYLAIALVALLVLGAGSATLLSPGQNAAKSVAPLPSRSAVSATASAASLLAPTSAPQPSFTTVEAPSPVAVLTPTEAIAAQVLTPTTPTLPPPIENPTEPP